MHGVEPPDHNAQARLFKAFTDCLEAAIQEGQRIAASMEERGLISSLKDIASRAKEVIAGIVTQLTEKVNDLVESIFGGGDEFSPDEAQDEIETQMEAWAKDYADMVATTEVSAAVEESILDGLHVQGVAELYWVAEPDACEICLNNAEVGAISIGDAWPSGDVAPPAHPRCRCVLLPF